MKTQFFRFTLYAIITYLTGGTFTPAVANLNVGEPRTVRLIYFLPNDRPYRANVVQKMKDDIRTIQTFYAQQMEAHGHGNITFRVETNEQGEPVVHRVDGQRPDVHYIADTFGTVRPEIEPVFDVTKNIYFIVIDNSTNAIGRGGKARAQGIASNQGKNGGTSLIPVEATVKTAAHELGHAFGLHHDFRDGAYLMSYGAGENRAPVGGPDQDRLSTCNAYFLSVHPYFNFNTPTEEEQPPTIELISPRIYPKGSESASIKLKVNDSEGLHQVILSVGSIDPFFGLAGLSEVKAYHRLAGAKDAIVEFEYDGDIPSTLFTSLSQPTTHSIRIYAIDVAGNVSKHFFTISEIPPYHIAMFDGHTDRVYSMSFSPDGTILASGSYDDTIKLWNVATGKIITVLKQRRRVDSISFSPDGETLAINIHRIKLWNVATGTNITTLKGHNSTTNSVSFSPDGGTLASGSHDKTIKLWDVATGTNIATLEGHTKSVNSVSFSPDGGTLASGSYDKTIKLWDVATGTNIATLEGHTSLISSVSFSPDGGTLASGSYDKTIKLWDVATGTNIATLEGHTSLISSVSFSPDGGTLASGSHDKTIKLWDVETGENIVTFTDTSFVLSVLFSPDGTKLASGTWEGTVRLWDVFEWTRPRPQTIAKISGDNQQGTPGTTLTNPLIVEVRDRNDNPLPDAQVKFTVTLGEGRLSERFTVENTMTDASGRAGLILTLSPYPGPNTVGVSIRGRELVTFHAMGIETTRTLGMNGDYRTWGLPAGARIRLGKGGVGEEENAVTFSPDGQYLAVSSRIGIWLYDAITYKELALLSNPEKVSTVAFSPDGNTLLSGVGGSHSNVGSWELNLWDVATRKKIASFGNGNESVAFSPDGKTIASVDATRPILWEVETGQKLATLEHEGHTKSVESISFSPDGSLLASGGRDNVVKLWDVATGQNIATLTHKAWVNSIVFSPDGKTLASGSYDNTLKLWNVAASTNITTFQERSSVTSVVFSLDGRRLAWASHKRIKLWDVERKMNIATFEEHAYSVNSVAFSPDGKTLASASSTDGVVKLWDVTTGNAVALGHIKVANSISFSPDGKTLASGAWDKTVKLWDVTTGTNIATFSGGHTESVTSVAYSSDGKTLASAGMWDGTIVLWNATTGKIAAALPGHQSKIYFLVFSPNGTILASGGRDHTIKLWDIDKDRNIRTVRTLRHTDWVYSAVFSPDGTMLASGGKDNTIKLWNVATGQNIATLKHKNSVGSISFSPDGTILASGTGLTAKLWDVTTRTEITTLEKVRSISFSLDGKIMASTNFDRTIGLWDVETQTQTATLEGVWGNSIFSPDGKTFAMSSSDTILLWDTDTLNSELNLSVSTENSLIHVPLGAVKATALLRNYPNPFNPETWIPYRLAEEAFVTLIIYDKVGSVVRTLEVGHQKAGIYQKQAKAIYWDGRNDLGEQVASGVYFYTLTAADYSATRRMVILK